MLFDTSWFMRNWQSMKCWLAWLVLLLTSASSYKFRYATISRKKMFRENRFKLSNSLHSAKPSSRRGEGCVLIAAPDQLDDEKMRSIVLITESDDDGTVGQIVNKPSTWTMGEMAYESSHFQGNTLFLGGKKGKDTAIMIHKYDLGGYSKNLGNGIYVGGSKEAREKVEAFQAHPRDFKFIFNSLHWAPGELEKEINGGKWDVYDVPTDVLLQQDEDENCALWESLRTSLNLPVEIRYS